MLSIKIVKTTEIMNSAAEYFWSKLKEALKTEKKILLLLSGGSAIEVYKNLADQFKKQKKHFAKNLAVGLVDERYGPMGHLDSNEKQIRDTGFYDVVKEKGGEVLTILTDKDDPCQEAERIDESIYRHIYEGYKVWAVLGIGTDGHTAGILPQKSRDEFKKIFPSKRLAVYYVLPVDYPNPFKRRITITPAVLSKINLAIVVAKSQGKEEALQRMFNHNEPSYRTPAVLLRVIKGTLFTDKKIPSGFFSGHGVN